MTQSNLTMHNASPPVAFRPADGPSTPGLGASRSLNPLFICCRVVGWLIAGAVLDALGLALALLAGIPRRLTHEPDIAHY
jgi:hypothetical protein